MNTYELVHTAYDDLKWQIKNKNEVIGYLDFAFARHRNRFTPPIAQRMRQTDAKLRFSTVHNTEPS